MYPHIRKVHVWSDRAAAKYKSKPSLHHIAQGFHSPLQIVWNFYDSRHGKSAADGEAAVVETLLSILSTMNKVIQTMLSRFSATSEKLISISLMGTAGVMSILSQNQISTVYG